MSDLRDFMNTKIVLNFEDPSTKHDRVLIVGGRKFYVVDKILSIWSAYFEKEFCGSWKESDEKEISLEQVDPDVFAIFLQLLYQNHAVPLDVDQVIPLIDMSFRFLAPNVLAVINNYIMENYDSLRGIMLQVLEKAWSYGIEDIKTDLMKHKKFPCDLVDVLKLAVKLNLDDFKNFTIQRMRVKTSSKNCSQYLDCSVKFNLPELKSAVTAIVRNWSRYDIPREGIIDLVECAFKHKLEPLKILLRRTIFHSVEETDTVYKTVSPADSESDDSETENVQKVNIPITINSFLSGNHEQIYALPSEMKEFIITSTFRYQ